MSNKPQLSPRRRISPAVMLWAFGTSIFLAILLIFLFRSPDQMASNCNFPYPGDAGTISLGVGDSLCIPAGNTFSGTVSSFPAGSKILISSGATFQPASMPTSSGKLQNEGSCFLPGVNLGGGFQLVNLDTLSFGGSLSFGGAVSINNQENGRMTILAPFNLNSSSTIANTGIIYTLSDVILSANFTNNGYLFGVGSVDLEGRTENYGLVSSQGPISLGGTSAMNNYCTFLSIEGFTNNNSNTQNFGIILVQGTNGFPNDLIEINQPFLNHSLGYMAGVRFVNNSTITGSGNYYFSGQTENNGPFGADGNGINFYDASSPTNIMDVENTLPDASVFRNIASIPDSFYIPSGCDVRFFPDFLPVEWQDISITLEDGDGLLQWSTQKEVNHDHFEVEKATDGKNFFPIAKIGSPLREEGNSKFYEHRDSKVILNEEGQLYYRLRQVDVDGNSSLSQVMVLSLDELDHEIAFFVGNPIVNGDLSFTLESPQPINGSLEVLDLNGKKLKHWPIEAQRGRTARNYALEGISRGVLVVQLRVNGKTFRRKVMMLSR